MVSCIMFEAWWGVISHWIKSAHIGHWCDKLSLDFLCCTNLISLMREYGGGDGVLVALEHGHRVDGLAKVPQPEGRVLQGKQI